MFTEFDFSRIVSYAKLYTGVLFGGFADPVDQFKFARHGSCYFYCVQLFLLSREKCHGDQSGRGRQGDRVGF